MVFDWIENSKRILSTGRLSDSDGWERRRKWTQELALMRYLRHTLGVQRRVAKGEWYSIANGNCALLSYDPDLADSFFSRLWRRAGTLGPLKEAVPAAITEGDVSALNSLEAPLEVRRYWLRLLVWIRYKEGMGELPSPDSEIESILWSDSGSPRRFKHAHMSILGWNRKCGYPFTVSVMQASGATFYRVAWKPSGDVVALLRPDSCPESAYGLLDKGTFVCPRCGRRHDKDGRSKTPLCPACQAASRRIKDAERKKKSRS